MKVGLTNNAVGFVRGVGALGDTIAPLSAMEKKREREKKGKDHWINP